MAKLVAPAVAGAGGSTLIVDTPRMARRYPRLLRFGLPGSLYSAWGMPSKVKTEAADDASKFLKASWFSGIPVDPVTIARRSGVDVVYAPLDEETLGALLKRPGQTPTILINQDDPENRKRFTCAHELGHFNRRKDETGEYHTIDLRSPLSATGSDPEEIYANEFAAALLMPADDLKIFLQFGLSDEELAERFKVSREAMEYRIVNMFLPA